MPHRPWSHRVTFSVNHDARVSDADFARFAHVANKFTSTFNLYHGTHITCTLQDDDSIRVENLPFARGQAHVTLLRTPCHTVAMQHLRRAARTAEHQLATERQHLARLTQGTAAYHRRARNVAFYEDASHSVRQHDFSRVLTTVALHDKNSSKNVTVARRYLKHWLCLAHTWLPSLQLDFFEEREHRRFTTMKIWMATPATQDVLRAAVAASSSAASSLRRHPHRAAKDARHTTRRRTGGRRTGGRRRIRIRHSCIA